VKALVRAGAVTTSLTSEELELVVSLSGSAAAALRFIVPVKK
jgi:hypothetical protein